MRKVLLGILAATAMSVGSAAGATSTVLTPGDVQVGPGDGLAAGEIATFFVTGDIFNGPIEGSVQHIGSPAGDFTDLIQFTIPQFGTGSGSVTTDAALFDSLTDTDITNVLVNGLQATLTLYDSLNVVCGHSNADRGGADGCGTSESWALSGVPITANVLNTIQIDYTSRGLGGYSAHLSFVPSAVPEPATWGMMLLGFGAVGFSMRRRRRPAALMQIA